MRFDLFYELSMPPLLARNERRMYAETLEEVEAADRLGFDAAWLVEHHFMRGYSHCSKPELFLAAAAARTRRIRLGLAIVPMPYHHPVHVAERVATLDLLSGGRIEVGIGRGFSPEEYKAFGVAMEDSRSLTEEALAVLRASFVAAPVSYEGRHFRLDQVDVLPNVVQQPHPPLWTAAVSPHSFEWAARERLGVLAGPFKPWFMIEQDIRRFRDAWRQHWGERETPRIGMTLGVLCLPDGRQVRRLAAPAFNWFYSELFRATAPVLEKLYPSYEHFYEIGRLRRLIRLGVRPRLLELAGMVIVGSPAEAIERIGRLQEAGVTHLLCAVGAGAVDTAVVRDSLACLAQDVMPAFRAAQKPV